MDDSEFDRVWHQLALLGGCDGLGGAEYHRVQQEWVNAGRPSALYRFILDAANRVPSASESLKE